LTGRNIHRLVIGSSPAEIARVRVWLTDAGRVLGVPQDVLSRFNVCADEALSNIMRHGHDDEQDLSISLRLTLRGECLELRIEDDGRAFDPLSVPPRRPYASLEEAMVGGLGIHLMRSLMDECRYLRENDKNVLTLYARLARVAKT
jgi:serine/threonine-protein kinase RsbW